MIPPAAEGNNIEFLEVAGIDEEVEVLGAEASWSISEQSQSS